jgi:hypothetical protein
MKHLTAGLVAAIIAAGLNPVLEANAGTINYALNTYGASFVSASSVISGGCCAINVAQMDADVVAATKLPWYYDGDTRYIFGANDSSAMIEISLGGLRDISTIGASIDLPSQGDRPVIGPFSVSVSTNGTSFTPWGLPIAVSGSTTDPLSLTEPAEAVKYIIFSFGDSGSYYGNFGGSAVNSVFALGAAPLPSTWTLMLIGLAGLGFVGYRQRRVAASPGAV